MAQVIKSGETDEHGQAISPRFSYARNRQRFLGELKGFLEGLLADGRITPNDVVYLHSWIKGQEFFTDIPVCQRLIDFLSTMLGKLFFEETEENELVKRIQSALSEIDSFSDEKISLIDEGLGVLRGISASQAITNEELRSLGSWLDSHSALHEQWPFSNVLSSVNFLLSKNGQDEGGKGDLLALLNKITGNEFEQTGCADTASSSLPLDSVETVDLEFKHVCFTGKFLSGTRKECEKKAVESGAYVSPRVTYKVSYLVVGDGASRDWKHASYGEKILKAVRYKEEGISIRIISESDFLRNLKTEVEPSVVVKKEKNTVVKSKKKKGVRLKNPPEHCFKDWVFKIDCEYWEIFGVRWTEWIDIEKAKPLRAAMVKELLANDAELQAKDARAIAVKKIRPKISGWAKYDLDKELFSEGYLFKHRTEGYVLQIFGFDNESFILLFFDVSTKKYIKLAEADFDTFIKFIKSGDQGLLVDRDPLRLPESEMKYEIKKYIGVNKGLAWL